MITCEHCRTGNLKWIYRDFNGAGSYLVDVVSEQSHICERLNGSQEYPHSLYTNFRNTAKVNFDINDRWITVWERKGIDKVGMARREKANWRKSKGVGDHLNDYRGALEGSLDGSIKGLGKEFQRVVTEFLFHEGKYVKTVRWDPETVNLMNEKGLNTKEYYEYLAVEKYKTMTPAEHCNAQRKLLSGATIIGHSGNLNLETLESNGKFTLQIRLTDGRRVRLDINGEITPDKN